MKHCWSRLILNIEIKFMMAITFICHPIKFIKLHKEYKEIIEQESQKEYNEIIKQGENKIKWN